MVAFEHHLNNYVDCLQKWMIVTVTVILVGVLAYYFGSRVYSLIPFHVHCLKKNDTDVTQYNFNVHEPILVIFGRYVAERVCYQMVICYPTSPN